jgi:histidinol-phosphate aminotransferase
MAEYRFRQAIENLKPYKPGNNYDEIKKNLGLNDLQRLMYNENPYGCSPKVTDAVMETLKFPSRYPDEHCVELRAEIAKKHSIKPDEMVFCDGADEMIYILGKSFIEPDDNAVTGQVTFFTYDGAVLSMGGKMIKVPMKNHCFDLGGILNAITPKTKLIFLANPNNPTGTIYTEKEQYEFLKKVPKNVVVVIDEAYADFCPDEHYPNTFPLINEFDNLVILKTFSKIHGMASIRFGYAVSNREMIAMLNRVKNLFNVSSQAQAAALAAIKDTDFTEMVYENNRKAIEYFYTRLNEMGIDYIPTNTSFIMVDLKRNAKEVSDRLMAKGWLARSGEIFNMANHLRVSIGTMKQMEGFADVLKEVLGL